MTNEEKIKVKEMRDAGIGYLTISKTLNINASTIKSFCKRKLKNNKPLILETTDDNHCLNCGKELEDKFTPRKKKFCSEECRRKYWNTHRELIKRKDSKTVTCKHCHKDFIVYGSSKRKYCSIKCYVDERFRNGKIHNSDDNV